MAKENSKMDMAQDKKMAKKAIGMHDKQMHGGKKTDLSTLKKGGSAKMANGGMLGGLQGSKPSMLKNVPRASASTDSPTKGGMLGGLRGNVSPSMARMKKGGCAKMAEGGMPMVEKGGKKVPAFAADGVGKMSKGGCAKMAKGGGIEVRGKTRGKMC